MLYLVFGFFDASINVAVGLCTGVLMPQCFYSMTNPAFFRGGQSGLSIVDEISLRMLVGVLFGGVIGLLFSLEISHKK